ncbi:hypothetical protein BDF21DRAFT_424328 [Thamnidium elegans]|nr:hypothetical protein BDF21DRAFT_424328 [Thamnidium elegans]
MVKMGNFFVGIKKILILPPHTYITIDPSFKTKRITLFSYLIILIMQLLFFAVQEKKLFFLKKK